MKHSLYFCNLTTYIVIEVVNKLNFLILKFIFNFKSIKYITKITNSRKSFRWSGCGLGPTGKFLNWSLSHGADASHKFNFLGAG